MAHGCDGDLKPQTCIDKQNKGPAITPAMS
jgi:hypothetical protein